MEIKVGDIVSARKPSTEKFMYMGLSGCRVVRIGDCVAEGTGEPVAVIEFNGEEIVQPVSHLTLEN